MKVLIFTLILLLPISLFSQSNSFIQFDSIDVRVYNGGKHYIKELILTVNDHEYQFLDIWERKYSNYQRLPFLWPSNKTKVTIIVKRFFKYDEWHSMVVIPIDHVGESKYSSGKCTLYTEPRIKKGEFVFDSYVIKE